MNQAETNDERLRVVISGSSGLIGGHLCSFLTGHGHTVLPLVRRESRSGDSEISWDPMSGRIDSNSLEGADAVVNLAGENIAAGRWTDARKAGILHSRIDGTHLLAGTLARLNKPPRVFLSASAIGYYGHRPDEWLTEDSPAGTGFLADVCRQWEAATTPALDAGIRTVLLRLGVVLSTRGGALARILTAFKAGVGGRVGDGRQYMSWIDIDDLVSIIEFVLTSETMSGPVNAVAPNPVTNADFAATLGSVLQRPAIVPFPAIAVRVTLGEMGQALLLDSARVRPAKLEAAGFRFLYPDLKQALRHETGLVS